jgi:hypothetical protein
MTTPQITFSAIILSSSFATWAYAAGITVADLDGAVIEATIVYEMRGHRPGGEIVPYRLQQDRKITIGPGDALQNSTVDTYTWPWGTRVQNGSGAFTINKPREVQSHGGGSGVWLFSNGILAFLRTYHSGGYKIEISFGRGASGLSCHYRSPFARENGVGSIEMGRSGGRPWQVISAKQVSSSCHVARH